MAGNRDPYRNAPKLIGAEPISRVTDDWVIHATCLHCCHRGVFARVSKFVAAEGINTAEEFKARVVCSRCGQRKIQFRLEFVGLRRD